MPQKKRTGPIRVESLEEFLEIAKQGHARLVEKNIKEMPWDDLEVYQSLNLADFAERRFMGMNTNNLENEHIINQAPFWLEHVADSPRKKAAEVVLEKFRESYERTSDLNFQQLVLVEAQRMLQEKEYELPDEQRQAFRNMNSTAGREFEQATLKMESYQNYLRSFFKANAIAAIQPGQRVDPLNAQADREVLAELDAALPRGPEYDIYRTRAGYEEKQPLPMVPRTVTMVMNPNAITNVTVDDFPASIHGENPSKINMEWGAATFDNMLETLYNQDEWRALKRDKKDLLDMIYLNGKPATDAFPGKKEEETYEDYQKRIKSELVATALEGKGKIDITPYRKVNDSYSFGDPVPVNVKVNLPEKVSAWKRFLRFFNIKIELKKEKAERLSLEDLNGEERREEIRRNTERIAARENVSNMVREKIEEVQAHTDQADRDFFGFLVPEDNLTPEKEPDYTQRLNKAVWKLQNVPVSPEVAEDIGLKGMGAANVMKTMERSNSRTSMVRMFALAKGMPMEEILSPDPALRERKEQIGREFMDIVALKGSEEFYKENGPQADYKAYFAEKSQKVYDMLKDVHRAMSDIPYDFFKGSSPQELMENYEKMSLVASASQDVFQCCPDHVKKINFKELDGLEKKIRSIGELRSVDDYCSSYVASDIYGKADTGLPAMDGKLVNALTKQIKTEKLVADTAGITRLGDLHTVLNEKWSVQTGELYMNLSEKMLNPKGAREIADYLERGGKPVHYFDEEKGSFVVGPAASIERALAQKNAQGPTKRDAISFKELDNTKKRGSMKLDNKQKVLQKAPMEKKKPQLQ